MSKHNKKRNTGIIYELMLMHMSKCIVENNKRELKVATNILETCFNKKSEIYKEFKIFNVLTNTSIKNKNLGSNLLREIKSNYQKINNRKLDIEKSNLIKKINYKLNDKNFYHRRVKNYVEFANIQNMFNEWRRKDVDYKKTIMLESKVVDYLSQEKIEPNILFEKSSIDKNSNKLVLKLMTEKINKKYANFSKDQKEIIREYAFYKESEFGKKNLVEFLHAKKQKCLNLLHEFKIKNNNEILSKKINDVINKVKSINENFIDDKEIIKFLTIVNLIQEVKGA